MSGRFAVILPLALLGLMAGCSSFPSEFKRAAERQERADAIEGAWQGTWKSDGGHHGALRCILTAEPTNAKDVLPGGVGGAGAMVQYRASFEAKFWGIFTGHYKVLLTGSRQSNETVLKGDQNLGWYAGGVYHYEARVTAEEFHATYQSEADDGVFEMKR